ncbi:O-antigen ligase family protein [Pseudomonas plecoglossicida]|uniref:O-antigen ligase family protein n=1 Tax=Pseudomonas plecoglossicida TaxID=70775 RepID=A0AAD0QWD8_PSEDL|nr:O-antigen ligase family protein [Pseudomonas plecoglossicida]AXM96878.1 O-antigen ligase family protein [Pseudomonas plecoglossicida]EPB93607.1 O-antigen polymerase [Pseudomonas plecoglossicida NB2011]QLB53750.1 O-antigen ligase family protein [Pseudomonas plecoglossicida]GLR36883.1 putative lipopolysaccharide biosynthesis protein [Pseudomonas plecoglossicida]
MLYEKSWARAWLGLGLVWFVAAIALAPSNKIYQQGLILFLWLPTLVLAWSARAVYMEALRRQPALWGALLSLMVWSGLTLVWSTVVEPGREVKRLVYILVFLMAFPLLAQAGLVRIRHLLQIGGGLLAIAALISIVKFYFLQGNPLLGRLQGMGEISHPILGAYVVGAALLLLLYQLPHQRPAQLVWVLALACLGAFVILSQSRGAVVSLLVTLLLAPLWFRDRHSRMIALVAVMVTCLAFYLAFDLITSRGSSYRPEIFRAALQMIGTHPWTGLGLGAEYDVKAVGKLFDHSHNMFTHVAVELGLPGMLLWVATWLFTLGEIVRARRTVLGKILLGLWLYSTMAMQFDAASLTATPRAEWFVSWLTVGLAMLLPWGRAENDACGKISGST